MFRIIINQRHFIQTEHSLPNPRTTISQDVQTRFPVQLAFAKLLSKIKGNFSVSAVSTILALY